MENGLLWDAKTISCALQLLKGLFIDPKPLQTRDLPLMEDQTKKLTRYKLKTESFESKTSLAHYALWRWESKRQSTPGDTIRAILHGEHSEMLIWVFRLHFSLWNVSSAFITEKTGILREISKERSFSPQVSKSVFCVGLKWKQEGKEERDLRTSGMQINCRWLFPFDLRKVNATKWRQTMRSHIGSLFSHMKDVCGIMGQAPCPVCLRKQRRWMDWQRSLLYDGSKYYNSTTVDRDVGWKWEFMLQITVQQSMRKTKKQERNKHQNNT